MEAKQVQKEACSFFGHAPHLTDFYRDDLASNVRGLSMAGGDSMHFVEPDLVLAGDAYRPNPDSVTRGVRLDVMDHLSAHDFGAFDGFKFDDCHDKGLLAEKFEESPALSPVSELASAASALSDGWKFVSPCEFFEPQDPVPNLPTDKHFMLSVNHVRVRTNRPHEIGICLLRFFQSARCDCDILKPELQEGDCCRPTLRAGKTKYSMKALVFVQSTACILKVKVFKTPEEEGVDGTTEYAVEFQRRNGDCVVFNKTYLSAVESLLRYSEEQPAAFAVVRESLPESLQRLGAAAAPSMGVDHPSEDAPPPPPSPGRLYSSGLGAVDAEQLAPLLDLARAFKQPSLQAEGAGALAELAARDARGVWTHEVQGTLEALLEVDDATVAYPTAKALRLFVESPSVKVDARHFACTRLSQLLQRQAESTKSGLVRRELKRVVDSCCPEAALFATPTPA